MAGDKMTANATLASFLRSIVAPESEDVHHPERYYFGSGAYLIPKEFSRGLLKAASRARRRIKKRFRRWQWQKAKNG